MSIAEIKAQAAIRNANLNKNNEQAIEVKKEKSALVRLAGALAFAGTTIVMDQAVNVVGNAMIKAEPYIDRSKSKMNTWAERLEAKAASIAARTVQQ
jgi:hypothetical protein